jgi:hypothetical protein
MATFNPVSSEALHSALENAGFTQGVAGKEVIYERANHHDPRLKVRVYTSAKVGSSEVVGCGKDAIRVRLVYVASSGKVFPVGKKSDCARVYRVGETSDILDRMIQRARDQYKVANAMAKKAPCKCGAPRWATGNCSEFCWKEKAA